MGSIRDTVKVLGLSLLIVGLTACGNGGASSSVNSETNGSFDLDPSDIDPLPNPNPTPTANPTPTPNATPTPNPTPSPIPNPSPTPIPSIPAANPTPNPSPSTNPNPSPSPGPQVGATGPCQIASSSLIVNLCLLVNQERAKIGAAPLTLTAPLNTVAQAFADDMYQNHFFSHTGLDGRSPFDRMRDAGISFGYAGENIAMGASTAEQVMSMWMNSSGHRSNILNPSFHKLGLGFSHTYWVQDFTD